MCLESTSLVVCSCRDVFNAALKRLNPKHKALKSFDHLTFDSNRPCNYTFRHVAHACVTYHDRKLLAETDSSYEKRLKLVWELYSRTVAEGVKTLQVRQEKAATVCFPSCTCCHAMRQHIMRGSEQYGSEQDAVGAMGLAPDVKNYLQCLSSGDDKVLLDFGRQWSVYIQTVKKPNTTWGNPFT